jgi:hypothetical protein
MGFSIEEMSESKGIEPYLFCDFKADSFYRNFIGQIKIKAYKIIGKYRYLAQ